MQDTTLPRLEKTTGTPAGFAFPDVFVSKISFRKMTTNITAVTLTEKNAKGECYNPKYDYCAQVLKNLYRTDKQSSWWTLCTSQQQSVLIV